MFQPMLRRKILREIKKIVSRKRLSKFWLFPTLKRELCGWNFETDAKAIQEPRRSLDAFQKRSLKPPLKKWVKRMEA